MPAAARIIVNADIPGPTISRHVYGHFAEHLGRCIYGGFWVGEDAETPHVGGIRKDVVDALRELAIPNLRWPGGCFADEYHWRDGVGPREARPRMVNTHWGGVEEDNSFGTHEFMALCELLGAEAYVAGNVGSGSVREMSEWVEYLTRSGSSPMVELRRQNGRDEPWPVRFWGIGNEPWGCGGHMRPEAYADLARQYATFCRDYGDNVLYRVAAGASEDDVAWTEALMRAVAELRTGPFPALPFQAVSVHYYTIGGTWTAKGSATEFDEDDYWRTIRAAQRIEPLLRQHIAVMDRYDPDREVGLVVDEWGTWWDVEPGTNPGFLFQQGTMRDALVASLTFDVFHRLAERVVMANIAQTVNVLQAMLLVDEQTGALVRTPTFHVFEMSTVHHDAVAVPVHVAAPTGERDVDGTAVRTVSASASVRDGRCHVSVSNLSAEPLDVELDLRGSAVRTFSARLLAADAGVAHNTAQRPDAVVPRAVDDALVPTAAGVRLTLPPHAFAVLSAS
ncbi:alpha-N-arabinofuranosidase [Motilibacter rhizosphaerae]|uniref:non-reducing end alpha-L-arabinofuranosidase n=1 Tax=Motilibacter rhizosphaerae TaxID=598652 RepID=A0A4Q7NSC2_9ACTN|nr:alpha-L-arabinofuranosidase C-terminal domain-containing protein [Motilibacter rhizosphaerae]RZS90023.1 alpha-N-arabinofuranosidase [Motilibacter rhizosphaerae]